MANYIEVGKPAVLKEFSESNSELKYGEKKLMTYPAEQGSDGYVLTTDGDDNISWQKSSGGGATLDTVTEYIKLQTNPTGISSQLYIKQDGEYVENTEPVTANQTYYVKVTELVSDEIPVIASGIRRGETTAFDTSQNTPDFVMQQEVGLVEFFKISDEEISNGNFSILGDDEPVLKPIDGYSVSEIVFVGQTMTFDPYEPIYAMQQGGMVLYMIYDAEKPFSAIVGIFVDAQTGAQVGLSEGTYLQVVASQEPVDDTVNNVVLNFGQVVSYKIPQSQIDFENKIPYTFHIDSMRVLDNESSATYTLYIKELDFSVEKLFDLAQSGIPVICMLNCDNFDMLQTVDVTAKLEDYMIGSTIVEENYLQFGTMICANAMGSARLVRFMTVLPKDENAVPEYHSINYPTESQYNILTSSQTLYTKNNDTYTRSTEYVSDTEYYVINYTHGDAGNALLFSIDILDNHGVKSITFSAEYITASPINPTNP